MDAIRPYLAGLTPQQQDYLLDQARRDGRDWPPQAGTAAGVVALMGTTAGQVEALAAGLSVHHPELSRADVQRIYRELSRESARDARRARKAGRRYDGEGTVKRIFAVMFGMGDPAMDDGEEPIPEA